MKDRKFIVVECGEAWNTHKIVWVGQKYTLEEHLENNFNVLMREQLVNSNEITDASMNMLSGENTRGTMYIIVKEII